MRHVRLALGSVFVATTTCAGFAACGGDDTAATVGDASTDTRAADVTVDSGGGDRMADTATSEGGPTCAPPSDPSKAALCITIAPETIAFIQNDARFDGKGVMFVTVYSEAMPPDDGGALLGSPVIMPAQDGGADGGVAQMDLSQPVPVVRIDGLPAGTVYPRAYYFDDLMDIGTTFVKPGWWLGGYDLSHGLVNAPLLPVTLQAGAATGTTMDLRALRLLSIDLTASVTPAGNGQGPLQVLVLDSDDVGPDAGARVFGFGAACADVEQDGSASVGAFFVGPGPYYTFPLLDDFGHGGTFPPGVMTSIVFTDAGPRIPAANQFDAGTAYVFPQHVDLDFTNPGDAAADDATCP